MDTPDVNKDCETCGPTKYKGLKSSEPVVAEVVASEPAVVYVNDSGEEKVINWREQAFYERFNQVIIQNVEGVEVKDVE